MNTQLIAIPGSKISAVAGAKQLQPTDEAKKIRLSIYVRQNPHRVGIGRRRLEKLRAALPHERRYLNSEEFNKLFGADPSDLDAVVKWATTNKLTIIDRSVPMRRVQVEGTIKDVQSAFAVDLHEYEHPVFGQFRGREGEIQIASELGGVVTGVFGLDTRPVGKSFRRRANRSAVPATEIKAMVGPKKRTILAATANQFPGAFFPPQVAKLYNYPTQVDGTGQNVAIFAFNGTGPDPRGGYSLPALKNYFEQVLGATTPSITDVVVHGPGNTPGPDTPASENQGDSTGEVMLDTCVVGSVAPGASIFMYFTEFTAKGWIDAIHQAITDENNISIISISYGNPENGPQSAWTPMAVHAVNVAFAAAAAKGITICCASGDSGSSDGLPSPHVDFPASSPNVLGVGGTTLVASTGTPPQQISSERVWNKLAQGHGATGGGISAVFSKPAFQNGVAVPPSVVPPHFIGRGVPDVAGVADPATGVIVMTIGGQNLEQIGGTSASAPIWASLIARLNQALQTPCGYLNAVLYTKCATGVLRDVIRGNNGAYAAKVGWDACTGLGSPNGQKLLAALSGALSSIAHVTPAVAARLLRSIIRPRRAAMLLSAVKEPARVARILNHMARPQRVARILLAMRLPRAFRVLKMIKAQRPYRYQLVLKQMRTLRPARTQQILGQMGGL
jgi:kumamolisin